MPGSRRGYPAWYAAFGLAAALHVALVGLQAGRPDTLAAVSDSREYIAIASNLAAGHGFSQEPGPPYAPDLRRTPVYPGMLAALFLLTGPSLLAASILNVILGLGTIALVCRLMADRFGARAATATGLLLATDPLSLVYHSLILTETTFALLLVCGIWLLTHERAHTWRRAAAIGVLLGAAALCRPIGLFLPLALLPVFAIRWTRASPGRLAGGYAALNLVYAGVVGVWLVRNLMVFGAPVLTSLGGVNLYFHRAAYVEAERRAADVEGVRDEWQREFDMRSGSWSEREKMAWLQAEGRTIIAHDLRLYAKAYAKSLIRMMGPETYDTFRAGLIAPGSRAARVHLIASWLHLAVCYGLVALGVARGWRTPEGRTLVGVVTVVVAYFVLIGGPEVYARFRMPLMPPLAMIGGLAFTGRTTRDLSRSR